MSRELDGQVSIAAYGGIARDVEGHGWLHASDEEALQRALKEHWWHWGSLEGPVQFAKPLPGYSEDIGAIWPLVEEMMIAGWQFLLTSYPPPDKRCCAEFRRRELGSLWRARGALTAPQAICEAFIAARKAWPSEIPTR